MPDRNDSIRAEVDRLQAALRQRLIAMRDACVFELVKQGVRVDDAAAMVRREFESCAVKRASEVAKPELGTVEFTVNGEPHTVTDSIHGISYESVVRLAGLDPAIYPSVTWAGAGEGILHSGERVPVKAGMRFSVYRTGNA